MMPFKSILPLRFCAAMILSFCLVLVYTDVSLSTDLTLAWDANSEKDLAGYKIYYLTVSPDGPVDGTSLPQGSSPIAIRLGDLQTSASPSFRLSGLAAGESYHFNVTAYNKTGNESDFSNLVRYDVPLPVIHPPLPVTPPPLPVLPPLPAENGDVTPEKSIEDEFPMEVGEVNVNSNWQRVAFSRTFAHPVVVASSLSNNDNEPAVVRIDNITKAGFEICVQEWGYLDDDHLDETIGYIVMEAGRYTLPDGTAVEAGTFETDGKNGWWNTFEQAGFIGNFTRVPVVVTSVVSYRGSDAVTIRLKHITATQFEYQIREQQAHIQRHAPEIVSYIAWEPCRTRLNGLSIEVARTDDIMTHDFKTITFKETFTAEPIFLSAIQTTDGGDTAALRWEERSTSNIQVKVEEEQSFDPETRHTSEVVGFFSFSPDTMAGTD